MGSPEVSRWWSVLKRKGDYLDNNVRFGLGVNMFNLYVSHFFVDQEQTLGQSENEFEAEWKWIWIPLASSWQLMPDSGMASKVAIWVGLDKVKQLGDRPSDSPVNLALKVSKLHHQRMLGPLHFISDTSRYDLALICRILRVWHFSTQSFSRFINLSIFFIRIYWNCWSMG